jgi:hypothetical protein
MKRRGVSSGAHSLCVLLVAGLGSSGCYRYAPVSPEAAASAGDVRVRITEAAARRLVDELGAYSTELDGQIASAGPDSLSVAVPIVREYRGTMLETTTQVLHLGRAEVVEMRLRQFSPGRTVLTTAGVLIGFGLLVRAVVQLTDPNPGTQEQLPPPPPPGPARLPIGHHLLLRIPVP